VINDKAWQSIYRKDKFDENLRYITVIINKIKLKILRVIIVKELILKI